MTPAQYRAAIIEQQETEMAQEEILYIGPSEAIRTEYSYAADEAFTVFIMYDGEPVSVEGFNTEAAAHAVGKEAEAYGARVVWLLPEHPLAEGPTHITRDPDGCNDIR